MDSRYSAWAARWRVPLGFTLGFAYLVFSQPTPRLLAAGSSAGLLGLLIRAWAAGHLDKNQTLTIEGPYRYTRNPLYLGSLVMGIGFCIAGGSLFMLLAFAGLYLLVYWPVIRREESFLRQKFGALYNDYAAGVPLLLPRPIARGASGARFHATRYVKNHEHEAALGFGVAIILLVLKLWLR